MQQTTSDCRIYERHACQVPTSCQPAAAHEMRWDCTIEDVSQSGLRLRLKRRFEPRTGLGIEIPGKDGQDPATVYVRVIHVRRDEDGTYALGCKFMSELSDDELQRLVNFGVTNPDSHPEIVLVEPERRTVADVRVWIGIGPGRIVRCLVKKFQVVGNWPVDAGTALKLRGTAVDGKQLEHPFEVVQCNRDAHGWALKVLPLEAAQLPQWLSRRA
jgi:hypothetical protein